MNNLFEILKVIIPAIITGFVTYWATKYNKRPIDKIKISYDRIYYPLFRIIKNSEDLEYRKILEETKIRLQKYNKYASRTTMAACKLLETNIDDKNVKNYFQLLEDDIYKYNSKFRRILGYPEPPAIFVFKYLSRYNKAVFVLGLSLLTFVSCIYLYGFLWVLPGVGKVIINVAIAGFLLVLASGFIVLCYKLKYAIQRFKSHILSKGAE